MRLAIAALCLVALTEPTFARYLRVGEGPCDQRLPSNIVEPSVAHPLYNVSQETLDKLCNAGRRVYQEGIMGCTYALPDGSWPILILNTVSLSDAACLVQYEQAHQPPNYWGDPKIELPETIKMLSDLKKAAHTRGRTSP